MAKKSILQRVKDWLTGGSKKKKTAQSQPKTTAKASTNKASNNESADRSTVRQSFNKRELLNELNAKNKREQEKQEEEKKKQTLQEAFKAKERSYKSMVSATKKEPPTSKSSLAKLDSSLKKDVPDQKALANNGVEKAIKDISKISKP